MASVQEIRDVSDVDALLAASHERPVALLKHSIACPISARGQREFVLFGEEDEEFPLYAVVVQYAREASAYVAEALGLRHETPQVILVKDGEAIYDASHLAVTREALREAAREATTSAAS